MKIVLLERSSLPPSVRIARPDGAEWAEYDRTAPAEVVQRAADADIVIVNKLPLDASILSALPRLKLVAVSATGTDNIDKAYCKAQGIAVANVRNYAVHTVPEHVFALILALRRNLIAYRDAVARGRWAESGQFCFFDYPIRDLAGSTLGIVGSGSLGRAVARLGEAFGMETVFIDRKGQKEPRPGYVQWETGLARSDVLTLHCPLSKETQGLIDDAAFSLMARHPLLINTARGGLIDEAALARALESGRISGAGLDVASIEPISDDHILRSLLDRPDFILTPHVAWASAEATQTLIDQLMDTVRRFIGGGPVENVAV